MSKDDFREKRIRIMSSFHPEGSITMNTSRKHESTTEEIDDSIPLTGAGSGKKICEDHQVGDERRFGIERRCFSYTVYIPERRSGHERRGLLGSSLPSYQQ